MDGRRDRRRESGAADASVKVYRVLLGAYPRGFREEYAGEMALAFRDLCREKREREGRAGLVAVWIRALPDLVAGAVAERSKVMGSAISVVGKLVSLRSLMALNGALLIAWGLAMFVDALGVLLAYGLLEPGQVPGPGGSQAEWLAVLPVKLVTQTLGAFAVCFGMLLLATCGASWTRGPALSGALCAGNVLLALSSFLNTAQYPSAVGWVTSAGLLALSLGYAYFGATAPRAPASLVTTTEPRRSAG